MGERQQNLRLCAFNSAKIPIKNAGDHSPQSSKPALDAEENKNKACIKLTHAVFLMFCRYPHVCARRIYVSGRSGRETFDAG